MHRLELLGRIECHDAGGAELRALLAQPKRLALLAYLAVNSGNGPCRRDRLVGVFWPELDQEHARKALNKSVHFLRRELGEGTIVSRGAEELAVDASRLWCDATTFVELAESGQPTDALELYRGELLPAFYVQEAPAFDEWLEEVRSRLRRHAALASRDVAEQRARDGQATAALHFARRAVELSDEDERMVRQLLELLDRLGDRAGALYAYDRFVRRLALDFDAEPAVETQRLVDAIRSRTADYPELANSDTAVEVARAPVIRSAFDPHSDGSVADAFRARGYDIQRELGRGGMATVYLARDRKHERLIALKVLAPELGVLRLADRFHAEIRVTAGLHHPNILPLFDSGEAGGLLYYAMPYVEGESLRARLGREKLHGIDEAIAIVRALSSALDYAHEKGVVHRDIKPENILLQAGQPLLADFGISLAVGGLGIDRLTATGLSVGTPQYMSPEQAAGEIDIGPPSDVYSLAAVAYELFTGEPPFTGPNARAILARVMLEPPRSIRTIRSGVPLAAETAVLRALAKHPSDRFTTATAFALAMQGEGGESAAPLPAPPLEKLPSSANAKATKRRAWTAVAVSAGLLLLVGVFWKSRIRPTARSALLVVAPFENRTGDRILDALGLDLAERVTLAMERNGVGQPVAAAQLRELAGPSPRGTPELARRLVRTTGAGLLVSGSYGESAGTLEVRAELVRMPEGKTVSVIEPVSGKPGSDLGDALAERLSVAVQANADWGDRFGWGTQHRLASNLAAYRAAISGDAVPTTCRHATEQFRKAAMLDSEWPWPLIELTWYCGSDSIASVLESRLPHLAAGDREAAQAALAARHQDVNAFDAAVESLARADPASWAVWAAQGANATGRLERVIELGAYRDAPSYWSDPDRRLHQAGQHGDLAGALHALGRDREALTIAQEYRAEFPTRALVGITMEFTARAGLGQVAEVERLVAEAEGIRPDSIDPNAAYSREIIAARELLAHGQPEAARRVAERGTRWLASQLRENPNSLELLEGYADALESAGAWDSLLNAGRRIQALGSRDPYYEVTALTEIGLAAAHLGMRELALDCRRRLASIPEGSGIHAANPPGSITLSRANISAALGDTSAAMDFFRASFNAGYWAVRAYGNRHRFAVERLLHAYPPYIELTRPR